MEWLFGTVGEPFTLFRYLITMVLGGISIFTLVEAWITLASLWEARKRAKHDVVDQLERLVEVEEGDAGRLADAVFQPELTQSQRRRIQLKVAIDVEKSQRLARKLAMLKGLQLISWKTVRVIRGELLFIFLLFVANGVALYFLYSF